MSDRPVVLFADHFYMTRAAINRIEAFGRIERADSSSEAELEAVVRRLNPTVIVSEYAKMTSRIFGAASALRGVVVWGVGFDHVDVDSASKKKICVANTSGSNAESVAEHTFAIILSLSRRLMKLDNFVRAGRWGTREEAGLPSQLSSQDLLGKTLGIVGLGAVGMTVARIGKGFGMRIIGYDPYINSEAARKIGVQLMGLRGLLRRSDVITLHVSLSKSTAGMIGRTELGLMKRTAFIINTSRGKVIDEKALVDILRNRRIAGAGLDVFDEEPTSARNPLLDLDNVILSPHCAGGSNEAKHSTSLAVSQEVVRVLMGEVPRNLVNRAQLSRR